MRLSLSLSLVTLLSLSSIACQKTTQATPDASVAEDASSPVRANANADASAVPGDGGSGGEDVEPVYPVEANAPAVPVAEKLCNALTTLPKRSAPPAARLLPASSSPPSARAS